MKYLATAVLILTISIPNTTKAIEEHTLEINMMIGSIKYASFNCPNLVPRPGIVEYTIAKYGLDLQRDFSNPTALRMQAAVINELEKDKLGACSTLYITYGPNAVLTTPIFSVR